MDRVTFRTSKSILASVDHRPHDVHITGVFPDDEGVDEDMNYIFRLEPEMFPNSVMTTDETLFYISTEARREKEGYNEYTRSIFDLSKAFWNGAFGNNSYQLEIKQLGGEFVVRDVQRVFTSWKHGATYWIKVQPHDHKIEKDGDGHVVIWVVDETHVFEPISDSVTHIEEVSWEMFVHPNNLTDDATNPQIIASRFTGDEWDSNTRRAEFWDQAMKSQVSLRCNVYFVRSTLQDQDEDPAIPRDSYGKSLSRSAVFQLNTMNDSAQSRNAKFYFPDRGEISQYLWSVANQAQRFELKFDGGWNWDEKIVDFDNDDNEDELAANLSRYEMDGGWRWCKMSDPSNLYTDGDDSPLRPFEYHDWDNYLGIHRPVQVVTCRVEVERGVNEWVLRDPVQWQEDEDRGQFTLRRYAAATQDLGPVQSLDYSLNCLLEFNNETVLMTQERGKPRHFSNLISKG